MDVRKQRALLAASVAGLLAAAAAPWWMQMSHAEEADSENAAGCYVRNACAGKGDCSGKGHSCSGQNGCSGQGYVKLDLDEDTCLRIEGGRLTAEPPAPETEPKA